MVANLTTLGFPEAEVRHCLRAANGNPDIAVEFLTNGIPANMPMPSGASTPGSTGAGGPLQALRDHPQFTALRRLVQSNPQMLQNVLTQIGQQQPELLQEINANQALFLQMMNEPVTEDEAGASGSTASTTPRAGARPGAAGGLPGPPDPAQMAQMMQNMDPNQLQMLANMMGLTPEQMQAVGHVIDQMPPEQLQGYMAQAMEQHQQQGGGGAIGGPQVLRLTEEEMASVDRLTELGFDRAEAAQAFLVCDKNEALAANLLMDSAAQEGAFPPANSGGGSGDGSGGNNDDDNVDDMYD